MDMGDIYFTFVLGTDVWHFPGRQETTAWPIKNSAGASAGILAAPPACAAGCEHCPSWAAGDS